MSSPSLPAAARVAVALLVPLAGVLLVGLFTGGLSPAGLTDAPLSKAPLLASIGILSWFIGVRWYGLPGIGLRGKRPLFASIGFAALAWLAFLILRFIFVQILGFGPAGSGRAFIYLLLFEAFCVQLWTFGLFFRSLADWRGPLTAAIGSGILFGTVAFLFFEEAFIADASSALYFLLWGIVYGIIRLRTGSLLGAAIVQTMQSFTAWVVMPPLPQIMPGQLHSLYLLAAVAYLLILWRLWPKQKEDYRV